MSDRDGVIESMCRYGRAIDTRGWPLLDTCFAEDAVVRYSSAFSEDIRGRADLATYLAHAVSLLDATQHLFGSFEVEIEGDGARFRCQVQAQHVRSTAPGGPLFTVGGRYANEAARGADGLWRMTLLEFEPIWTAGNPDVLAHEEGPRSD